jgi:hypothetical protein
MVLQVAGRDIGQVTDFNHAVSKAEGCVSGDT